MNEQNYTRYDFVQAIDEYRFPSWEPFWGYTLPMDPATHTNRYNGLYRSAFNSKHDNLMQFWVAVLNTFTEEFHEDFAFEALGYKGEYELVDLISPKQPIWEMMREMRIDSKLKINNPKFTYLVHNGDGFGQFGNLTSITGEDVDGYFAFFHGESEFYPWIY